VERWQVQRDYAAVPLPRILIRGVSTRGATSLPSNLNVLMCSANDAPIKKLLYIEKCFDIPYTKKNMYKI